MAARLGNVLYWAGCGIAAICLILAAWIFSVNTGADQMFGTGVALAVALLSWLIGRAARYVLAGT